MRNIYLIRHGEPEFPDGRKRCIGWTDLPLSEQGRRRMEKLRDEFLEKEIEKIYVSPLARCEESARILSGGRIPVVLEEDLREIHMGEWENLSFQDIKEHYPREYEERGRRIASYPAPGGESFLDCQKRVKAVFERIRRENRGNVAIVAHAGVNRALISYLEGKELQRLLEIPQGYGEVYTFREMIFDGLIAAAGMSSRMGDFKPLMELGGKTVIGREIETLKQGGAREIAVVTGNRAAEIEEAVKDAGVVFLHNKDYESTKMFDSVSIGLRYFEEKRHRPEGRSLDGIYFLPVDVPLFTAYTMECERKAFSEEKGDVYCPCWKQTPGHPLLIRGTVLEELLSHNGERGLKGACDRLGGRLVLVATPDRGAMMDMDTQEDFMQLSAFLKERENPDDETCGELFEWFGTGEDTVRHCRAVARLAEEMAVRCSWAGAPLNLRLVRAAALLHDLRKNADCHAAEGGRVLRLLGYTAAAGIVEEHMELPEKRLEGINESLIVYLADKMVKGETRVSVEERFVDKRLRFSGNPEAMAALEERYARAKRAEELVKQGGFTDEVN